MPKAFTSNKIKVIPTAGSNINMCSIYLQVLYQCAMYLNIMISSLHRYIHYLGKGEGISINTVYQELYTTLHYANNDLIY